MAKTRARKTPARKTSARKSPGRTSAAKKAPARASAARKASKPAKAPPAYRLVDPTDAQMTREQSELRDAIMSGPRGKRTVLNGPFAVWLQAPAFGQLAQRLGAHCRYNTALEPRLSEFAILVTARLWKAQYEWFAHEPMALKAGVKPATVKDIKAGRLPKSAPKDERALYDFIRELYKTKRVSDRNYKRVRAFLDDGALVELIGILGYYSLISMTLNTFRAAVPAGEKLPFAEPA